ncbi:hypothetical protein ACIRQP_11420 [Streptomyces sp. NPDC102274]|uniref:hypothetical protein n=1 Tax=Streptomyces sp. NPDC102274 TaxID=3366151 RepID=UPI003812EF73
MTVDALIKLDAITPEAEVTLFRSLQEIDETCEVCFARRAIGTFNVQDVETPLCGGCSAYRNSDNSEIVIVNEPV